MNEILKNLKHKSKRYIKLNTIYNQISSSDKRKIKSFSNSNSYSKFIVVQTPLKKSFFENNKKLLTNVFFSFGVIALSIYHRSFIKESLGNFTKKYLNEKPKKYLNYLLTSEEIREGGVDLLDRIFKHKNSKQSTVELLNCLLENPEVMKETKKYGVGLFNDLLKEDELKKEVKHLFLDILKSDEIKTEGVSLLQFILDKEESKDIMSQYFKVMFLRADIIKALSSVITDSAIHTMNIPTTKRKFAEFVIDVWSDPNLRWYVIKKSLNFWEPASATVKKENIEVDYHLNALTLGTGIIGVPKNTNLNQNLPEDKKEKLNSAIEKVVREEITSIEMISTSQNSEKINK